MGIEFNIDKLLKPYRESRMGKKGPKRSLGTIATKLLVDYRLPPDVVGEAIFKVFYKMAHEGLEFKGNGKPGSKGAELFSCIKAQAVDMTKRKAAQQVVSAIQNQMACALSEKCPMRTRELKKKTWRERMNLWIAFRGLSPLSHLFGKRLK